MAKSDLTPCVIKRYRDFKTGQVCPDKQDKFGMLNRTDLSTF